MKSPGLFAWFLVASIVLGLAGFTLARVRNQQLFLLRLPFDRAPFSAEIRVASQTARTWMFPALLFLAIAIAAVAVGSGRNPIAFAGTIGDHFRILWRTYPRICGLFLLACLADLISTVHYFHAYRIDDELHPGIKLVTYAFGLSIGCLIGKTIQAVLGLSICAFLPRIARPVLVALTLTYTAAMAWNLWLAESLRRAP
jgi:hypothetical protein